MFPRPPDVLNVGSAHRPEQQQQEGEGLTAKLVHLIPALCVCAAHVEAGRFDDAMRCVEFILDLASLCDSPLPRLARIMVGGLVGRHRLGRTISRALIDPSSQKSVRAARSSFIRLLPFIKMGYVAINRVILEAMGNEQVHFFDDYFVPTRKENPGKIFVAEILLVPSTNPKYYRNRAHCWFGFVGVHGLYTSLTCPVQRRTRGSG